jgi:hypothetical protein
MEATPPLDSNGEDPLMTMSDLHIGAHEMRDWTAGAEETSDETLTGSSSPLDEIKNGLKVWADVGLTLGKSIDKNTDTIRRLNARLQHNTPVDYGIGISGVFPAAGTLLLNFGSPDQGTRWEVTGCVVGGVDAFTAAAGRAGLYVSSVPPIPPTSPLARRHDCIGRPGTDPS